MVATYFETRSSGSVSNSSSELSAQRSPHKETRDESQPQDE